MLDIYITTFIIFFNIILFVVKYKEATIELKLVGLFMVITFFFESYANYLLYLHKNNLFVYHIYTPVQYTLLSLIFYYAIENYRVKRAILFFIPIFIILAASITLTIQSASEYHPYAVTIKNILLVFWVLYYYRELFVMLKVTYIEREPLFWISTGVLFYSLGDFFVEGLMNYLISYSKELAEKFYFIYFLLNILLYLCFIMAFICRNIFSKKFDKV